MRVASVEPDTEERLLLALVRYDALDPATALLGVDQLRLMALLEQHRLVTLAGGRLLAARPDGLTDDLRGGVERRTAEAGRFAAAQHTIALHVLGALDAAGVRAVPLKGSALAARLHGDVARRESVDVDVLVAPRDLRRAAAVVEGLGWDPPTDWTDRNGLPRLHLELRHPRHLPAIELHWRVHWYEERYAAEALARAAVTPGGADLQLVDLYVFLLLFYARDGLHGLRLPADLLSLRRLAPGAVAGLAEVARRHPALAPALVSAEASLARIAGDRGPSLVPPTRRARGAVTIADPLMRLPAGQRLAEKGLVDLMLAPLRELPTAVRRQLVPPMTVLRQQQPRLVDAGRPSVAAAGVEHAVRMLRRFINAPLVRARLPTALPPT